MNKQEKIREGVAELYWLKYRDGCHYPGYWEKDWATLVGEDNNELGQQYVETCREFANEIIHQEASQGVVIKVERELPEIEFFDCANIRRTKDMALASKHTINLMLKWYNDSLIPLVEE